LSCQRWSAARPNEICKTLEREMEWTRGHAIVSPSYRVTFETVRRTYCALSVLAQDTAVLVDMVLALERKPDENMARLQLVNGSRYLLNLQGKQAFDVFLRGIRVAMIKAGRSRKISAKKSRSTARIRV
jgi:hypothetical protein